MWASVRPRKPGPAFAAGLVRNSLGVGASSMSCSQATCALSEVMSVPASAPAVLELYPQLFAALLLRVSCTLGVQLPRTLQAKERRAPGLALASRNLDPCR